MKRKPNYTDNKYITKQGRLPMFIADILDICDDVLVFDRMMEEINIKQYLSDKSYKVSGRPGYNRVNMLKAILFGFKEYGYVSLRKLEDLCRTNIRYMYLMDYQTPSYRAFSYFINNEIGDRINDIFKAVIRYIKKADSVDMNHIYIDGTKLEASSNKYKWVWKKSAVKSRFKMYSKITSLFKDMNDYFEGSGFKIETRTEYTPDYLDSVLSHYEYICSIDESTFVHGPGHKKTVEQKFYEKLQEYIKRLREYVVKEAICGPFRNSYSKTDHDATFMRMKKDYMGNDQLLPAYNIQIGVADEYIAVVDVMQYCSDMDCFVPLMEKFYEMYGFYPKFPIADAGYGSFNNYLYCLEHGMEKYMKFPMYKKETTDKKYRDNQFRPTNFRRNEKGNLVCPNGKEFHFSYRKAVRGNKYGRQEEVYECEDCSGCPYANECKKTDKNRTIRLNEELTSIHQEVLNNLESVHGALLRMNRSIQAEGTFGIMKNDRSYKRIVRRGINSVKLEINLVSIGHNLYKYMNKMKRLPKSA